MVGCITALCSDIFMLLTCIDFFSITASLGSLISLGGVGVLTGHILDGIFDFFWDLCCFPICELIIDLVGEAIELIAALAYLGPIVSAGTSFVAAITHELPGIIYDCGLGNCYGIMELFCGIGNILCLIPTGCLAISSIPFCFSPLFYPFGCIAVFLSSLISFLASIITPIMGIGGCFRTIFVAICGDIISDVIGDYITDIILTPLFKLLGGYLGVLISFYYTGWAGWFLGIFIDMGISLVMGIVEVPLDLCGEVVDMIAEASSIGLSTVETIFGYGICCLPMLTLPCYIGQCIVNFICCLPFCWI